MKRTHRLGRPRHTSRSGLTILEITVSTVILTVAVGGILGSLSSFTALGEASREVGIANMEAQRLLETMRAQEFGDLFAMYNGSSEDDPTGTHCPGSHFSIEGLDPIGLDDDGDVDTDSVSSIAALFGGGAVYASEAPTAGTLSKSGDSGSTGMVGEILFPVDPDDPTRLLESAPGFEVDLDGDGQIDDEDHAASYALLPIRVRIAWSGATGNRVIQMETILSRR